MKTIISDSKKLPKRVVYFWTLHSFITHIIALIINVFIISLSFYLSWNKYVTVLLTVVLFIIIFTFCIEIIYLRYIKYNFFRYCCHKNLIEIEYGVYLFKTYRVIPTTKIYSLDIYQGPLLKKYDLYNIKLVTMANTHEIEGLELNEAKNIQKKLNSIKDG